jgi:hypothetical protein
MLLLDHQIPDLFFCVASLACALIFEKKIYGHADEHDYDSRYRRRCAIDEQNCQYDNCTDQVNCGNNGVSEGFVRPFGIGFDRAQSKQRRDGQDVENQCCRNDVIEQVAVEIAVSAGGRIIGANRQQDSGPEPLHNQGHAGDIGAIQN